MSGVEVKELKMLSFSNGSAFFFQIATKNNSTAVGLFIFGSFWITHVTPTKAVLVFLHLLALHFNTTFVPLVLLIMGRDWEAV